MKYSQDLSTIIALDIQLLWNIYNLFHLLLFCVFYFLKTMR